MNGYVQISNFKFNKWDNGKKKQAGYIIQTIIIKYKLLNIKEKVLLQLFSIMIYLFYFYFILFLFL